MGIKVKNDTPHPQFKILQRKCLDFPLVNSCDENLNFGNCLFIENFWVTLYFKSLLHPRFTAVFFKSFSDLLLFFSLKIDNFMFSLYVLAQTQELRREIGRMLMKITIPSDVLFNHGKFSFFIIFIVLPTNSLTYNY